MTRKSIKNSFNELFEQRQLPSIHARERMLNFQMKRQKSKIQLVPALVTVLFFIGISVTAIGYVSNNDLDNNLINSVNSHDNMVNLDRELSYFNNTFSIKDEKFYLYGVTYNDSKAKVIEILGNDYIEETNLEIGGSHYYDRLIYEKLDLTILFNQDKAVSITVKVNETEEFERLYESYNGGKFHYEGSTDTTSEHNEKLLYSEETMQIVSGKYDPYQTFWLSISYASPEFISNLKEGIYE